MKCMLLFEKLKELLQVIVVIPQGLKNQSEKVFSEQRWFKWSFNKDDNYNRLKHTCIQSWEFRTQPWAQQWGYSVVNFTVNLSQPRIIWEGVTLTEELDRSESPRPCLRDYLEGWLMWEDPPKEGESCLGKKASSAQASEQHSPEVPASFPG